MYPTSWIFVFASILDTTLCMLRDFAVCHDDFSLQPKDGLLSIHTFTWLAFIKYTHITTGLPHHSKAPRVVLIHKEFVLGTSTDMIRLPKNYKLGNVVFGDYEQDEESCGITQMQIKMGKQCPRAYLEMPHTAVITHPEFTRFGVGNSLAVIKLLRPMKSHYTLPICLPSAEERARKKRTKVVYLIDYVTTVPRQFDTERMGKKSLKLYTHSDCRRHRMKSRLGSEGVTHVLCTSGCGVRPGAPIISQTPSGAFELIGVAAGSAPCTKKSHRRRLNIQPPLYIDVYPYINWIANVVAAHVLPMPYPQTFKLTGAGTGVGIHKGYLRSRKKMKEGWKGRNYVCGNWCFKAEKVKKEMAFIYAEKFVVNAKRPAILNVHVMLSAGIEVTILCVSVKLPNRQQTPSIRGVGGYNITVEFNTDWFPYTFPYSVAVYGKNTTYNDWEDWYHERTDPRFW